VPAIRPLLPTGSLCSTPDQAALPPVPTPGAFGVRRKDQDLVVLTVSVGNNGMLPADASMTVYQLF
jgi:hypothetical protein